MEDYNMTYYIAVGYDSKGKVDMQGTFGTREKAELMCDEMETIMLNALVVEFDIPDVMITPELQNAIDVLTRFEDNPAMLAVIGNMIGDSLRHTVRNVIGE